MEAMLRSVNKLRLIIMTGLALGDLNIVILETEMLVEVHMPKTICLKGPEGIFKVRMLKKKATVSTIAARKRGGGSRGCQVKTEVEDQWGSHKAHQLPNSN